MPVQTYDTFGEPKETIEGRVVDSYPAGGDGTLHCAIVKRRDGSIFRCYIRKP